MEFQIIKKDETLIFDAWGAWREGLEPMHHHSPTHEGERTVVHGGMRAVLGGARLGAMWQRGDVSEREGRDRESMKRERLRERERS